MNIIGCLDRPTSGEYILDGEDVSKMTSDEQARIRNCKIGFVFQNFNLLRRTSALENVMVPLIYADGVSEKEAKVRAEELLRRVGLADRLHHEPTQLSGGQQQRIAIARALVNRPAVLLADEPTGNLDSTTTKEILQMFEALNNEGTTIVLVTHEVDVAEHAKRTIKMSDGQLALEQL